MMKFAIASAAALFVAAPAFADTFDGFRVEVNGGWDRIGAKISDGYDSLKGHKTGFNYGVEAGWDYQSGGFVFGPYAGVDFSTAKECTEVYGDDRACLKAGRNFEAGVRAGAVVSKVALVYAKVAYANGRAKLTYKDYLYPSNNFSEGANRGGIRVGVGTQYALSSNVYLKAEYRYTHYKTVRDDYTDLSLHLNRNQVVGGIGYRF
ncbi:outer membrane protein [Flavisphingomonas formosensis]|uniref:outer membrane protein n=1 Tax=Flavisphingomonas formosensis TaxID=861534 RepID=UPI0012FC2DD4|nr:porin family protein [Sphingomonas formosensis]